MHGKTYVAGVSIDRIFNSIKKLPIEIISYLVFLILEFQMILVMSSKGILTTSTDPIIPLFFPSV